MKKIILILLLIAISVITGCERSDGMSTQADIVVTNSYLQSVLKDLAPDLKSACLSPPGMCPGHFDLTPKQANMLNKAQLLMQFDFQKQVSESTENLSNPELKKIGIKAPAGMCLPASYLRISNQVAKTLISRFPEKAPEIQKNLQLLEKELNTLSEKILNKIKEKQLTGKKIICSSHQRLFCSWLGFDTVASFRSSDLETGYTINELIKKAKQGNLDLIVANRPEGTDIAESLSEHLEIKMVVIDNFPDSQTPHSFHRLLNDNLNLIIEALQ